MSARLKLKKLKIQMEFMRYTCSRYEAEARYEKARCYNLLQKNILEIGAFAEIEIRKTKRALWLARAARANAEWGHWATIWFCNTNVELNINKSSVSQDPYRCTTKRNAAIWRNIWHDVERKCRAKAEQYK